MPSRNRACPRSATRTRRDRCAVAIVSRGLPAPGRPAPCCEEIATLAAEGWPVRWVQPETSHLTLHFLGETERERAELVRLAPLASSPRTRPSSAHGGARRLPQLPPATRPLAGVAWTGAPVTDVAEGRRSVRLQGLGFTVGDEPYHPHITLGRVRNDDGERVRLRDLPDAVKDRFVDRQSGAAISPPSLPVPVREVVLMRSHLGPEGRDTSRLRPSRWVALGARDGERPIRAGASIAVCAGRSQRRGAAPGGAIGRLVAERGHAGLRGSCGSDGRGLSWAREAGGVTIGIIPGYDDRAANPWVEHVICTGRARLGTRWLPPLDRR